MYDVLSGRHERLAKLFDESLHFLEQRRTKLYRLSLGLLIRQVHSLRLGEIRVGA
jgi:hypothetical protein